MKRIHSFSSFIGEGVNPGTSSTIRSGPLIEPSRYITEPDNARNEYPIKIGNRVTTLSAEMMNDIDWEKSIQLGHLYDKNGKMRISRPVFDLTTEAGIDLAINFLSSGLDSYPSGYTQVASFCIDILHALSFGVRWKLAKKEEEKWAYFITAIAMLLVCWIPRGGNMVLKKFLEGPSRTRIKVIIRESIQRFESLKSTLTQTPNQKIAWVLVNTILVFLAENGFENLISDDLFLSAEEIKSRVDSGRGNRFYKLVLGGYDKEIDQILSEILEVYSQIYASVKDAEINSEKYMNEYRGKKSS